MHNRPETTLNLWVASDMTKSNRRQIDQGVSEHWLFFHVETYEITDRQAKQQLVLH